MTRELAHPPIVEAVLDIDCDLPPGQELSALEAPAREHFSGAYPKVEQRIVREHRIETRADTPHDVSFRHAVAIDAVQFAHDDGKQLVQVRSQGYSFNRLAPYTSLDDYLSEIERTWRLYVSIATPVQIRQVRLRYINRLLLPLDEGKVRLKDYLRVPPTLPDEERLTFTGFVHQHAVLEPDTGNQAHLILASQAPEGDRLPVILDIGVVAPERGEVDDWPRIEAKIHSLRALKNHLFDRSLTKRCLKLYR